MAAAWSRAGAGPVRGVWGRRQPTVGEDAPRGPPRPARSRPRWWRDRTSSGSPRCPRKAPRNPPGLTGGVRIAPNISRWPRGSRMRNRRMSSALCRTYACFSAMVAPGMGGTPPVTIRVGSPHVCVSIVCTTRRLRTVPASAEDLHIVDRSAHTRSLASPKESLECHPMGTVRNRYHRIPLLPLVEDYLPSGYRIPRIAAGDSEKRRCHSCSAAGYPPDCLSALGTGATVDRVVGGCAKAGANRVPAGGCWEPA